MATNAEKPEIYDFIVFRVPDSRIRGFGTSSTSYENQRIFYFSG